MNWNIENTPKLHDKLIVVTGGNSGLGFESIKKFAKLDANIIMAARSEERALDAIKKIKEEIPNSNITFMELDLSSKASIKQFASNFQKEYTKLDILLNNAGVMMTPYGVTKDGIETQQGINHFGHFYLTALLFKVIKNTPKSRIVNVSSIAHRFGSMNFKNLLYDNGKGYNKVKSYARSKLENLLFTYELASRVEKKGYDMKVLVAHPGVAGTNLGRHLKNQKITNASVGGFKMLFSHTASDGALSLVRACLDESAINGEFYGPKGIGGTKGIPHVANSTRKSKNKTLQKQLWKFSEDTMNIDFVV